MQDVRLGWIDLPHVGRAAQPDAGELGQLRGDHQSADARRLDWFPVVGQLGELPVADQGVSLRVCMVRWRGWGVLRRGALVAGAHAVGNAAEEDDRGTRYRGRHDLDLGDQYTSGPSVREPAGGGRAGPAGRLQSARPHLRPPAGPPQTGRAGRDAGRAGRGRGPGGWPSSLAASPTSGPRPRSAGPRAHTGPPALGTSPADGPPRNRLSGANPGRPTPGPPEDALSPVPWPVGGPRPHGPSAPRCTRPPTAPPQPPPAAAPGVPFAPEPGRWPGTRPRRPPRSPGSAGRRRGRPARAARPGIRTPPRPGGPDRRPAAPRR